jgi:orotidine-5'-phosphate decarboxylase
MIIDKLFKTVEQKGHVCLGLDTDYKYLPDDFKAKFDSIGEGLFNFNKKIIDATLDVVACYKVQIAYYEAYGFEGLKAYSKTLKYIKQVGAISIADIKRGDIAKTAEMYAAAHLTGDFEADMITLNPYMGLDSIEPYEPYFKNQEKGCFVLIRTSNPGSKDIEYIETKDGQRVFAKVGEKIHNYGMEFLGECGYSAIGGVLGCTHVDEAKAMRKKFDKMFFLIPGYGAQGGTAEDVALYLKDGNGGVVNSSRAILLAYRKFEGGAAKFDICAREAAIKMRDAIRGAINECK